MTTRASLASIGRAKPVDDSDALAGADSDSDIGGLNDSSSTLTAEDDRELDDIEPPCAQRLVRQDTATSTDSPRLQAARWPRPQQQQQQQQQQRRPSPLPPGSRWSLDDVREALKEATAKFVRLPAHSLMLHSSVKTLCFAHCRQLPAVQQQLERLQQLERRLLVLELRRKIANRLRELSLLAEQIEKIKNQEYFQLQDYRLNGRNTKVNSKIECVYALCERLRASASQLQHVRLFVQQNAVLQECLPQVRPLLREYQDRLHLLFSQALTFTFDFIHAGLRVLAFTDLTKYTREDLFEISRGIEEFNSILDLVKGQQRQRLHADCLSFGQFASSSLAVEGVRPMSFSKILACLARERSAIPVEAIHDFYFGNRDLVRFLRSQTGDSCDAFLCDLDDARVSPTRSGTSDYYSDEISSLRLQSERAERALGRFTDRLVQQGSPVADYIRLEFEFASGFLDCVAQSTQLLPKQGQRRRIKKDETVDNLASVLNSQPPARGEAAGAKKGVRWSDHSEVTVRHHVVAKYLELVWREVDARFPYRMARPAEEANSRLGCGLLLQPAAMQLLAYTVHFTATDSLYPAKPSSLLPFLHSVALRLHLQACHSMWEGSFSRFLGLRQRSDSLQPTLLARGPRCSKAGKAFLDCLRPCAKAVSLCVAELDAWLQGQRITAQLVTGTQLQPHLSCLGHWLATASASCQAFLRAVNEIVANAFANDYLGVGLFLVLTDLRFVGAELAGAGGIFKRLRHLPTQCSLKAELDSFAGLAAAVQLTRQELLKLFAERCLARARAHVRDFFPSAKAAWKVDQLDQLDQLDSPRPQPYAAAMFASFFEPLLPAVSGLARDSRLEGLGPPVASLANAWSSAILAGKVRFNCHGARQLEADVNHLADFLDEACGDRELTSRLVALEPMRELRAGIRLLRRQPVTRAASCGALPCTELQVFPSEPQHSLSDAEKQAERDVESLRNKDNWLSLRSHGKRKFVAICG